MRGGLGSGWLCPVWVWESASPRQRVQGRCCSLPLSEYHSFSFVPVVLTTSHGFLSPLSAEKTELRGASSPRALQGAFSPGLAPRLVFFHWTRGAPGAPPACPSAPFLGASACLEGGTTLGLL